MVAPWQNVVAIGTDTSFICSVKSNVDYHLDWTVKAALQDNIEINNNTVLITSVVPANRGIYSCTVRAGTTIRRADGKLDVLS